MILDYNSTEGGVDNLDKVRATRIAASARLPVGFGDFQPHCGRAYVPWTEIIISGSGMPANFYLCQLFLEELGKALVRILASLILSGFDLIGKVKLRSPKQHPVDTGEKMPGLSLQRGH